MAATRVYETDDLVRFVCNRYNLGPDEIMIDGVRVRFTDQENGLSPAA